MTRQIPILFKGEMVRAILAGLKTNTRRVMKPQPPEWVTEFGFTEFTPSGSISGRGTFKSEGPAEKFFRCPYGMPGDELWVKENFQPLLADGVKWTDADYKTGKGYQVNYVATSGRVEYYDQSTDNPFCSRVTPSIFMPKWASRIRLTVTEVRVERVQDISEADAIAEGIEQHDEDGITYYGPLDKGHCDPRYEFQRLWRSINDGREGCAWYDNPWVWCVVFEVKP